MTDPSDDAKPKKARAPANPEAQLRQQAIGVRLRALFDEVVREPVPESFLEILRRADSEGRNGHSE